MVSKRVNVPRLVGWAFVIGVLLANGVTSRAGILLSFEYDAYGNPITSAPMLANQTTALREEYASLGVHFRGGGGPNSGGSIFNEGPFYPIEAYSGDNVLGFSEYAQYSDGGYIRSTQVLEFDYNVSYFSMMVAGRIQSAIFEIKLFNKKGDYLADKVVEAIDWTFVEFRLDNIQTIIIQESSPRTVFEIDDIYFEPWVDPSIYVPEPSSMVLGMSGAALVGGAWLRRRQRGSQSTSSPRGA